MVSKLGNVLLDPHHSIDDIIWKPSIQSSKWEAQYVETEATLRLWNENEICIMQTNWLIHRRHYSWRGEPAA